MTELLRSGSLDKLSVGMLPDYSPEVAGFFQQVASSHLGEFSMRGLAADEELIFGGKHYEEGRILTIKDLAKVSFYFCNRPLIRKICENKVPQTFVRIRY